MIIPGPLVAAMMAYASHVSGYPIPVDAPAPKVTTGSATIGGTILTDTGPGIRGVTFRRGGGVEIVLHPSWTAASDEDNCVLAHELTHYLQLVNRRPGVEVCETMEPPAYRVTAVCFEDRHMDADDIRWAWRQATHPPCGH